MKRDEEGWRGSRKHGTGQRSDGGCEERTSHCPCAARRGATKSKPQLRKGQRRLRMSEADYEKRWIWCCGKTSDSRSRKGVDVEEESSMREDTVMM
jgi:hypothetical protein